jgi:hypothetical protein
MKNKFEKIIIIFLEKNCALKMVSTIFARRPPPSGKIVKAEISKKNPF